MAEARGQTTAGSYGSSPRPASSPVVAAAERIRWALITLDALLSIGAIAGGLALVLYPNGGGPMDFDPAYLEGSPFASYLIPGLFLCVLGFGALIAAALHYRRIFVAPYLSFAVGAMLIVFEAVELAIIPFSVLQPAYFAVGMAIAVLATRVGRDEARAVIALRKASRLLGYRAALAFLVAMLGVYAVAIHPWFDNWGASTEEQQMALPGDQLRPDATWRITRAITIDASADVVWAWLIQHGQDRAGFYSYTWLENLTGADIHNLDELRPAWQERSIGEAIPLARPLLGGRSETTVLRVAMVEPGQALVTTSESGDVSIRALVPIDDNTTRLIFRDLEGTGNAGVPLKLGHWLVWEPMHFVMQHGMLAGLKVRAEGDLHQPAPLYYAARAGWLLAAAAVVALFARSGRSLLWLDLPSLTVLPAILLAGDPDAALAGFIAAGILTLGALRWGRRWWPSFLVLAAFVLLVLLLAADAYLGFGLLFLVIIGGFAAFIACLQRPSRIIARTIPASAGPS